MGVAGRQSGLSFRVLWISQDPPGEAWHRKLRAADLDSLGSFAADVAAGVKIAQICIDKWLCVC